MNVSILSIFFPSSSKIEKVGRTLSDRNVPPQKLVSEALSGVLKFEPHKDDFKKKEALRNALVAKGFKVRIDDPYKLSILHPHVAGLFLDIDLVYEKNGYMVVSNARAVEEYLYSYFFKKDIFKSLKTMQFANMDVLVPEGAEDFLETVYGDWRTPHDKSHHLYGPLNLRIEQGT